MMSRVRGVLGPFLVIVPLAVFACQSGGSSSGGSPSTSSGGSSSGNGTPTDDMSNQGIAEKAWSGQKIDVRSDGSRVSVQGGVSITANATATKVTATAEFRPNGSSVDASSDPNAAPTATLSIVEEGGAIVVRCTKTAAATDGGCNKLTVVVPAGTSAQPLALTVTNDGPGDVSFDGRDAVMSGLTVTSAGSVEAKTSATKGAEISVSAPSSGDITLGLPADFAADVITLTADTIVTTDFPDVKSGEGRGAAGTGAKSITLSSSELAGSTGTITLKKN